MTQTKTKKTTKLTSVLPPVRCTEDEKKKITLRAQEAGLNLSQYIRSMALNGKITIKQSDADFDTIFQLKKIGVNLNQHAKLINSTGALSSDLNRTLLKIEQLIDQLLK